MSDEQRTLGTVGSENGIVEEDWVEKYSLALKTGEDRKVFLDLVDRAGQFGRSESFFQLLLYMLLAQQVEIERLSRQV